MRAYDAGKKVNGRKRHIVVDTLGLVLASLSIRPKSRITMEPSWSWEFSATQGAVQKAEGDLRR